MYSGRLAMVYFLTLVLVTRVFAFINYLNLADMFYAFLYTSDLKKMFPPKNVIERKICDVEILMRFELLWMKNLIF